MKSTKMKEWVEAEIAARTPEPAPKGVSEEAIAEKLALGITRAQAIAVITAQNDYDAAHAKTAKTKK